MQPLLRQALAMLGTSPSTCRRRRLAIQLQVCTLRARR
jgi:hypothetical protein